MATRYGMAYGMRSVPPQFLFPPQHGLKHHGGQDQGRGAGASSSQAAAGSASSTDSAGVLALPSGGWPHGWGSPSPSSY
jgi:hypothetical protein